jgi:PKHD-type hydroxylase
MQYQVVRVLQRHDVDRIVSELSENVFSDGKLSAFGQAREVKDNLQFQSKETQAGGLDQFVISALQGNVEFQAFALPKRLTRPTFSRYEPGMAYGSHIDSALMGGFNGVRTDLAMTLFLHSPDSYDGGELVLEQAIGNEQIKLDAGEAIIYPASTVHHVAPVTRGTRLAAIVWTQSVVRDERLREILFDLFRAAKQAEEAQNASLSLFLSKSYHNLLRYAAEP